MDCFLQLALGEQRVRKGNSCDGNAAWVPVSPSRVSLRIARRSNRCASILLYFRWVSEPSVSGPSIESNLGLSSPSIISSITAPIALHRVRRLVSPSARRAGDRAELPSPLPLPPPRVPCDALDATVSVHLLVPACRRTLPSDAVVCHLAQLHGGARLSPVQCPLQRRGEPVSPIPYPGSGWQTACW
jgi:hypothetical protein